MGVDRNLCSTIHETSILEGEVILSDGVTIGPYCHIIGPVKIGEGTSIGSFTYVEGPAELGARNRINPHCVIGTEPESRGKGPSGMIIIGDDNVLTEFTVIQRGTGDRDTEIGNNNFIMDNVHIAHDNKLFNNITIAPNVVLAGHVIIQDGATIGIGSSIHQFSTIGAYCMVGMGSIVTKDVPPFSLVSGTPAKFRRWNSYQLEILNMGSVPTGELAKKYQDDFHQMSRRSVLKIG